MNRAGHIFPTFHKELSPVLFTRLFSQALVAHNDQYQINMHQQVTLRSGHVHAFDKF